MSEPFAADIECLLRQAFAPVDPPETLATRLESTLQELTELAAEELESWELSSMRDPGACTRPLCTSAKIARSARAGFARTGASANSPKANSLPAAMGRRRRRPTTLWARSSR